MLDGWEGSRHGFQLLGGPQDNDNPTLVNYPTIMPLNTAVTIDIHVRPQVIAAYINGELITWQTPAEQHALGEVLWPNLRGEKPDNTDSTNRSARLIPREDAFDVLRLECRVHADGVGANSHMYGLQ